MRLWEPCRFPVPLCGSCGTSQAPLTSLLPWLWALLGLSSWGLHSKCKMPTASPRLFPGMWDLAMSMPAKTATTLFHNADCQKKSSEARSFIWRGRKTLVKQLNHRYPWLLQEGRVKKQVLWDTEQLFTTPSSRQQVISAFQGQYTAIDFPLTYQSKLGKIPSQLI